MRCEILKVAPTTQACDVALSFSHHIYQQPTCLVTRISYQNQEYRKQSCALLNIHITGIQEYTCNSESCYRNSDSDNRKTRIINGI